MFQDIMELEMSLNTAGGENKCQYKKEIENEVEVKVKD